MHSQYQGLLFDCDGVLVNSEQIVDRIYREQLNAIGIPYSQAEFGQELMGLTRDASHLALVERAKRFQVAPPTQSFYDNVRGAILAAFEHELIAVAGAHRLASRWSGPQAVASSSVTAALHHKLAITGLADVFGAHVYSADLVAAGKPEPDIFLHAAQQIGVPPAQCLAIEDSVNGIISAKRAGMTVYGFTGGGHCLPEHDKVLLAAGAELVFASHAAIAQQLALEP